MKNSGFTLVELLIVVTVLAILSSIIAPKIFSNVDTASDRAIVSSAKQIQTKAAELIARGDTDNFCGSSPDPDIKNLINSAIQKYDAYGDGVDNDLEGIGLCRFNTPRQWIIVFPLNSNSQRDVYCIDSTGFSDTFENESKDSTNDNKLVRFDGGTANAFKISYDEEDTCEDLEKLSN